MLVSTFSAAVVRSVLPYYYVTICSATAAAAVKHIGVSIASSS